MKKLLLLFTFLLLTYSLTYCQNKKKSPQFWISSGIGQVHSQVFNKIGMVGGMGFHLKAKHHYFSGQVNQFWELPQEGRANAEINEMKLQYGWIRSIQRKDIFIAVGISNNTYDYFITTINRENGKPYDKRVLNSSNSLVLETGINWQLSRHLGVGLQAMGSFNNTAITSGYRLSVLFGLFE